MKTTIKKVLFLACLSTFTLGCDKDDDAVITPDGSSELFESNGITADALDNYQGSIGLIVNTRNLVEKGYDVASVSFDIDAQTGNYNAEIPVEEFTKIAIHRFEKENLSQEALEELSVDGVPVSITVKAGNGSVIFTQDISVISFTENGTLASLQTSTIPYVNPNAKLKPEMPHFIQIANVSGGDTSYVVQKEASDGASNTVLYEAVSGYQTARIDQQFYFYEFPNEPGVYAIYNIDTNRYLATDDNDNTLRQSGAFSYPSGIDGSLHPRYKFRIQRAPNGFYTINRYDINVPYKRFFNGFVYNWRAVPSGEIQYFNFIALNLDWEATDIGTEYLQPVMPAVETSFGFNSTLINCGSGSLSQEVGVEQSITTGSTAGWEESLSIASRNTFGLEVSVGVSADATFFGTGGSVSAEVTGSYEYSREATQSSSSFTENTVEEVNTYFSTRQVTVPSGKASLVYDAYQTYSNVEIPFVQRLRIRANEIDPAQGNVVIGPLNGAQVETQLQMMGFRGVITSVGSDFVEVTLRGTTYLDNLVDTESKVLDVAANCPN
ncbi:hypothetical protein EAX61_03815 [Dokdonia sinensis]|uniref:Uncharacterized protein n=1 Tax=Dokdonia sinensis TaxID=2479847 RepID=A0A3M0GPB2_9FLAO|nr:RICIN domain-containing protein [Dokdonia sinensis]RMB63523.1 hypothetical protein EAX61_03815 [Dokdonia sinensis]